MKHFKSRFFWFAVLMGLSLWAVDYFVISRPKKISHDFYIYSACVFILSFVLDVYFRRSAPETKSWLQNKID